MECPFCTATLPDDDVFCEECGKPLHKPTAEDEQPCPNCGAPAGEIAEDGFCERCGHRARRPPTDHIEIVLADDFAGVSDRGRMHDRNEDRFAIRQVEEGCVLVVCDGVSSSTESEQASSLVSEHVALSLEKSLLRHSASSPERTVRIAIEEAQEALVAANTGRSEPPSTTIVAAVVNGQDVVLGWAGDSRAYWIDAEGSKQMTADHSIGNHGITRWLGADAGENSQPEITRFEIPGPGTLLLCTDGLWNYMEDFQTDETQPALDIARKLVDEANEKGGQDNITAVLLRRA